MDVNEIRARLVQWRDAGQLDRKYGSVLEVRPTTTECDLLTAAIDALGALPVAGELRAIDRRPTRAEVMVKTAQRLLAVSTGGYKYGEQLVDVAERLADELAKRGYIAPEEE